jgi:hypothetical protein
MKDKLNPIDVAVHAARNRANPLHFSITATNIPNLLSEVIQLAKLISTEERDIEAIRTDYMLRSQKLKEVHEEVLFMIEKEYSSRDKQTELIHENVKLLIVSGQYHLAQKILERLTDILSDSPLKQAMQYRIQSNI